MRLIDHQGAVSAFASINDITARKSAELELALLNTQHGRIVDEIAQLQARLREQSVRDALTGPFNRRYFEETTQRELHRCAREQLPLLDADYFNPLRAACPADTRLAAPGTGWSCHPARTAAGAGRSI